MTRQKKLWMKNLLESVLKLTGLKIPCHVLFYENGKLEHFGTPDMMTKFENQELGNSETWSSSLKAELLKLVENNESVFDQEKIDSVGITNYFTSLQKLNRLPAPLSVCLYREIVSYLSYFIMFEPTERVIWGQRLNLEVNLGNQIGGLKRIGRGKMYRLDSNILKLPTIEDQGH